MSTWASRLAWGAWALTACMVLGILSLVALPTESSRSTDRFGVIMTIMLLGFTTVGALIASRRPRNSIGWLFIAVGLTSALMHVTNAYIQSALDDGLDLPALALAGWLNSLGFTLSYPLVGTYLLLLFPDGHLPSPRWRLVGWAAAGGIFLFSLGFALLPGPYHGYEGVENPLGIEAIEPILGGAIILGGVTIGASTIASTASLVVRWRRATGVARQQLKWIAWAAIAVGGSFAAVGMTMATGYGESVVNDVAWTVGIAAIIAGLPVVTGIAILRHRLFDIDRIINRTLVYGLLTTMLGAAYLGLILTSNSVVTGAAGGDTPDLVIAGATLAVAALFQPLRRRIQSVVDRRFYRSTYDAARTIDIFAARLREEVELESLEAELRAIVRETMQPSHVSLWLRPVKQS